MTPSQQAPSLVERLNDPIAHDRETTVQLICRWRTERREAAARITELEGEVQAGIREILALRADAERAEAQCRVLQEALKPFAEIEPSTLFPSDGSEGEVYDLHLTDDPAASISGTDLARARQAMKSSLPESPSADAGPYPRSRDDQHSDGVRG